MISKLLVLLDGSAMSEHALELALKLARPNCAQVILLYSLGPARSMLSLVDDKYAWLWPEESQDLSR
jgi:nucleotide-binding universal stress UspA family protein